MKRVADLVRRDEHGQALVRLWVLAGQTVPGGSRLNQWERSRNEKQFRDQVRAFLEDLQRGKGISEERIEEAPLAFITALDEVYLLLHRSAPPWNPDPFEEEGARYWLHRIELSHRGNVPFAKQAGNREAWFRRHIIVPVRTSHGIDVSVVCATGKLAEFLLEQAGKEEISLLVWIGHLNDDARLKWSISEAGRFRLQSIEPPATRNESICKSLEAAAASGADILVFPEFTIDLQARRIVRDWMLKHRDHPFKLLVAGSFHEETPDGWFNTAEIWNRIAEPVVKHRKLRLFGSADGLAEDVGEGKSLTLLLTPIGILSVLICKDFMDEHQSVAALLQEAPVDWALVPSYGDDKTWDAQCKRALALAKLGPGTSSIVSTQRNIEVAGGAPLPGFCVQAPEIFQQVAADGGLILLKAKAIPIK